MALDFLFVLVSTLLLAQLNEALAEALHEFCTSGINDPITDLLAPLLSQLSHLVTPGLGPCHPATSCMEILQVAPQSPSGFYWIRANEHDARHMYCDMETGLTPSHPATSCMEILQVAPQSPSGLYWIRANEHAVRHMYCDMERSCNGVAGGWMRIESLNMTKAGSTCPDGLKTLSDPQPLCAMNRDDPGCSPTVLPVQGVQYSRVCGKIIGYQQKTPDAFRPYNHRGQTTIDSYYVDGISITHGSPPRKHIWTFAAATHEHNSGWQYVCPCTNTRNSQHVTIPPFVGNDYFCDTGSENRAQTIFYGDDPLWDGEGCGQFSTCCSWNSPPWFMKQLSSPTSDDIEMRLCCDAPRSNEDITIETLEMYVQ